MLGSADYVVDQRFLLPNGRVPIQTFRRPQGGKKCWLRLVAFLLPRLFVHLFRLPNRPVCCHWSKKPDGSALNALFFMTFLIILCS